MNWGSKKVPLNCIGWKKAELSIQKAGMIREQSAYKEYLFPPPLF